MANKATDTGVSPPSSGFSGLKLFAIIFLACTLAIVSAVWISNTYLLPRELHPVVLSPQEQQRLDSKLERLGIATRKAPEETTPVLALDGDALKPEPYTEDNSKRAITLSERELNALLAKNTDLGNKLAIDLSDNLASAKLLLPLDEELPVLGGQTLKITAGLALAYGDNAPIVSLKGVSLWGVPLPNAWLGNLKDVNLIDEFGQQQGFWQSFAAGIDDMQIGDGNLKINLKE